MRAYTSYPNYTRGDVFCITTNDGMVYKLEVMENYISFHNKAHTNSIVDEFFQKLGIQCKYTFASKVYGYDNNRGVFPAYNKGDYAAATRMIHKLINLSHKSKTSKHEVQSEIATDRRAIEGQALEPRSKTSQIASGVQLKCDRISIVRRRTEIRGTEICQAILTD